MGEDIFLVFPILKLVIGSFSILLGMIICKKNKFFKYPTDDMSFATELKMFLSGLLLVLIGVCAFFSFCSNYFGRII